MSRVVPLGYKKEVSTLKAFALAINCRCEMGIGVGQGCSEGTPAGRACKVTLDVFLSFTVPKCRVIEGVFFSLFKSKMPTRLHRSYGCMYISETEQSWSKWLVK